MFNRLAIALMLFSVLMGNQAQAWEFSGFVGVEDLGFFYDPLDPRQHNNYVSGVIEAELYHDWDEGTQSLAFVPFFRYSQHDNHRTHFDIRELAWQKYAESWELRVGFRKVFWGVTEGIHLVDIINQTDRVENIDHEDKLGQPMINLALSHDWGTLDLFLLTGFRERTFPGVEGRLRTIPVVSNDALFEKEGVQRHLAYAIRWAHAIGDWDIGFSHFYGTGREPTFILGTDQSGTPKLFPFYPSINQTSLDIQATKGSWLWKLESFVRAGQGPTIFAITGGLEYTFFDFFKSGLDIGLVVEYMYDSRSTRYVTSQSLFRDDFLTAIRLGFNDVQNTEMLAGVIFDRTDGSKFYSIEASRRFGESFTVNFELRLFDDIPVTNPAFVFRDDDHVRVQLNYHF